MRQQWWVTSGLIVSVGDIKTEIDNNVKSHCTLPQLRRAINGSAFLHKDKLKKKGGEDFCG